MLTSLKVWLCALTFFVLTAPLSAFAATTYYVSPSGSDSSPGTSAAPFLTIQHGITAAVNGDTVIVEDGTYSGTGDADLDFGGRNITVASQNGPSTTIIDCGGVSARHRGFYFHSGETNAVVSGLTIKNGFAETYIGGGVYNDGSAVTLMDCTLTGNQAGSSGGAVANASGSTVTLTNCTLTGNQTGSGGGINNSGTATLTNCVVSGNRASYNGGGVVNENSGAMTLTNCVVNGNDASNGEGTSGFAGGVDNGGTLTLTNCIVTSNSAIDDGGGFYNAGAATLTNCAVAGNMTYSDGGGVANEGSGTVTLTNSTVASNYANSQDSNDGHGGGVYSDDYGTATLTNDILFGDSSELYVNPAMTTVTYCDVQGGYAGTGNINADPKFVSGNYPYNLNLLSGSPCIGAGTHNVAPATDITGYTRPNPPSIGAYEYVPGSVYLKSLTANPNGSLASKPISVTAALTTRASSPATITLISSNPAVLSVPGSVTVGTGYTSVAFQATSYPVTQTTYVTITATYNGFSQTVSVDVFQPQLSKLTISPTTIISGRTATLDAILDSRATVNASISLFSSNTAVLRVPDYITIGTGYTSRSRTLTSLAVTTPTTVVITADYLGNSASVDITVLPVALASVTASPTTIHGGVANSSVTVALTASATNTANISLTSSNPAALSVPATAAIGTGYTSRAVTATSHAVTTSTIVTVTATYNGVSKTATVTVTP